MDCFASYICVRLSTLKSYPGHPDLCFKLFPEESWHIFFSDSKISRSLVFFSGLALLALVLYAFIEDNGHRWKSMIFMDFEDFMKSDGTIITGTPPQSGQGEFFASETCVSEVFEKV